MRKWIIIAAYVAAAILSAAAFLVVVSGVAESCPLWVCFLAKGAALAVLCACSWLLPPVREKVEAMGYWLPLRSGKKGRIWKG